MLQQVMTKPGEIVFREIERAVPWAGQISVRMMRLGICGSDLHVYHGTHPVTSYPVTQGHEVSGIIDAIGPGGGNVPGRSESYHSTSGGVWQMPDHWHGLGVLRSRCGKGVGFT